MIRTMVWTAVLLVGPSVWGDELKVLEGPAAQRGWIVVVRSSGGGMSGRFTDELPGKYATRSVKDSSGLSIQVFDNLKMKIGLGDDEWSVVASRWYQGVGNFLLTNLAFLDPSSPEFSDKQALELLLAYRSFTFGEVTYVIFCPPRARITWQGEFSVEPIIEGECKANATADHRARQTHADGAFWQAYQGRTGRGTDPCEPGRKMKASGSAKVFISSKYCWSMTTTNRPEGRTGKRPYCVAARPDVGVVDGRW